jgi:hypothetical protein
MHGVRKAVEQLGRIGLYHLEFVQVTDKRAFAKGVRL